ncbi:hypothetical protein F2Q69_00018206 [Brassica cretica]|uniref:Uncharacterized protein n=1 Tax=Brassica cretica TaxID=69181 RepID=A0A8S9QK99_BRACR|nr:hypothetical protein F2Q69_00018206 [Brassica cretica]
MSGRRRGWVTIHTLMSNKTVSHKPLEVQGTKPVPWLSSSLFLFHFMSVVRRSATVRSKACSVLHRSFEIPPVGKRQPASRSSCRLLWLFVLPRTKEIRTAWSGLVLGHKAWRNSFGPYTCRRDQNGILDALERIRRDALASVHLWIRSSLLLAYSVHKTAHDSLYKDNPWRQRCMERPGKPDSKAPCPREDLIRLQAKCQSSQISHGIRARLIRTWLKLPHIPHTSLSSNPSHEEDSSIRFSFSMKTEAWRVILVPQPFLIPALMKSHVGSKGGWRGVMNLKPKLLVHELLASGYKKSRCHEDGDLMYEERRGV